MATTFYLHISCNHLHLTLLASARLALLEADRPFSNRPLLVAEFSIAERLIKEAVQSLMPKRLSFDAAPKIVDPATGAAGGGLSQVEQRILMERGMGAGAREVALPVGEILDADGVRSRLKQACA